MIIVDISIWIEFFKLHEPYYSHLRRLLEKREVFALSPIFGELLQGIKSRSEKGIILQYWENLPKVEESNILIKAGIYSSENNYVFKGVGLIDVAIVIAALENNSVIWTLDRKLLAVLKHERIFTESG